MRLKRKYLLLLGLGLFFLLQAGGICWSQSTERVSLAAIGGEADGASNNPSTSANGGFVAFESGATDLVSPATNGKDHIFVRDLSTGTTTQVSVDSVGTEGDRPSNDPSISGDGRYVAFESFATNLVAAGGDALQDIYVRDCLMGITTRVSENTSGNEADGFALDPSISADGRYVAFHSDATDLVPGGSDGSIHIFVHDRLMGTTVQVSVNSTGIQGNADSGAPSISADGRYVAFESSATNLVSGGSSGSIHIFVHDRDADGDGVFDDEDGSYDPGEVSTLQVSVDSAGNEGDLGSRVPSISADGRYVAFESDATNLLGGGNDNNNKADVFVHDLQTGTTTRVSVDSAGTEGNDISWDPSISANGKYVAFASDADNLVAGDTPISMGGFRDIFLYERESLPPTVALTSPVDNATNAPVDAGITATFSEPMQASTINTTTFTMDNGITGTVSYDANSSTATFTPSSNLDNGTTYTATITTGAEDMAGNGLQTNHAWSFTTQSEGNSSGNGPCFIATAADGSVW